jgi:predicted transposase YbfD/YdcC
MEGNPRGLQVLELILSEFGSIIDHRVPDRRTHHVLVDILTIAFLAVLTRSENWEDMEDFGLRRFRWLKMFLELPNGIPSADTFRRVISQIDGKELNLCLVGIARSLRQMTLGAAPEGPGIAIDGKTLRGSFDRAVRQLPIHLVNAFCTETGLTLGQFKTAAKSNEITAIPYLLGLLDIKGCVVTLDALLAQTDIVEDIVRRGGNYVIALKKNHPTLHERITTFFLNHQGDGFIRVEHSSYKTVEKGHGRLEERKYISVPAAPLCSSWKGVQSITMVESSRTIGDKTTTERRYFLSSLAPNAERVAYYIRSHWAVENSLHWRLDVTFNEDKSRVRKDRGPENFSIIRKITMNILKAETASTDKVSIRRKRFRASIDQDYLEQILGTISL